jgi:hypothetical protein
MIAPVGIENPNPVAFRYWVELLKALAYALSLAVALPGLVQEMPDSELSLTTIVAYLGPAVATVSPSPEDDG